MSRLLSRRKIALAVGISVIAAAAALAETDQRLCGDDNRPCGPLLDDGARDVRAVAGNLEQGPADSAFAVTIDGHDGEAEAAGEADHQRRMDVALAEAGIKVQVSSLTPEPMLSVVPERPAMAPGAAMRFHLFSNYQAFIERAELRLFRATDSLEAAPLAVVPVTFGEPAVWRADDGRDQTLRVVLRVYDKAGRFDETAPQEFLLTSAHRDSNDDRRDGPLFENQRVRGNIDVAGIEVTASGQLQAPDSRLHVAGQRVALDKAQRFVARQILPEGVHDLDIRVETAEGSRDYRRSINRRRARHFLVAIADLTAGHRSFDPGRIELQGEDRTDPRRDYVDGRLAFYYKGLFENGWKLTASADTGENPLSDLFDGFLKKDSRSFLRRMDPDRHYPVYGDDSITVEDAPTYGRFYVRAENDNALAMWGNFQTQLTGTELMRFQRSLYGGNLGWRSSGTTGFGERRTEITGFAADPGTIGTREDFASTGGSNYYFRNRDLAPGSERLFAEVRDRDSGLVLERRELMPGRDYEVNYIQGRVLLRDPLPITADASLFVRNASLAGHPVWLVANYEYVPGLARPSSFTIGGRAQHWLGDVLRVGVTAYHQGEDQAKQDLFGADLTLRLSSGSWLRAEVAQSDGPGNSLSLSSTGGYDFTQLMAPDRKARAFTLEGAADVADILSGGDGRITAYWRNREAGFSGPGELNFGEDLDQFGGTADIGLSGNTRLRAKTDMTKGSQTDRQAFEAGIDHDVRHGLFGNVGIRSDKQQGQATAYTPYPADPGFEGKRTDVAATIGYRHAARVFAPAQDEDAPRRGIGWEVSLFGQKTLERSGGRLENDRIGIAGAIQPSDRLTLSGEVSDGSLGTGAQAKADYALGERGSLYLGYALAAENPDAFTTGRLGRLTAGAKRRVNEHLGVFAEGRYEHGSGPTGLTQSYGVDFDPLPAWTFGLRYETGSLADAVGGRIKRDVVGGTIDYSENDLRWSTALEYRRDGSATYGSRTTWATRNQATWQANDALRLFAKANMSLSDADSGSGLDANYYELALAGAWRPIEDDRLNLLAKYTYLADEPSPAQVDQLGLNMDYAQRSHIFAIDGTYQLTNRLAVGGKLAYRVGELRVSRDANAPWFNSHATFWALRADYRIIAKWDVLAEVRRLSSREAQDARLGGLVGVYRHLGQHVKMGVGYNFTNYSDDLGNMSYDEKGLFLNLIGKF